MRENVAVLLGYFVSVRGPAEVHYGTPGQGSIPEQYSPSDQKKSTLLIVVNYNTEGISGTSPVS